MNAYRVEIEGESAYELYVERAEEPTSALEAGLKRYGLEHGNGTARKCRVSTLAGEVVIETFVVDR